MSALRVLQRRTVSAELRRMRRAGVPIGERDPRQGGGKFTKPSPKLRRHRRRRANQIARASRKANR